MNKVIASLLSITLVALNTVSAYSQVPLKGAKGFRAASKVKVTLPVSSFSVKNKKKLLDLEHTLKIMLINILTEPTK